jgi:hypothetical protein
MAREQRTPRTEEHTLERLWAAGETSDPQGEEEE